MRLQSGSHATMGYDTGYYTYDVKPTATYPKGATAHGSYMSIARKEGTTWQLTYVHVAEDLFKTNK
jgi:hypothetical protein